MLWGLSSILSVTSKAVFFTWAEEALVESQTLLAGGWVETRLAATRGVWKRRFLTNRRAMNSENFVDSICPCDGALDPDSANYPLRAYDSPLCAVFV